MVRPAKLGDGSGLINLALTEQETLVVQVVAYLQWRAQGMVGTRPNKTQAAILMLWSFAAIVPRKNVWPWFCTICKTPCPVEWCYRCSQKGLNNVILAGKEQDDPVYQLRHKRCSMFEHVFAPGDDVCNCRVARKDVILPNLSGAGQNPAR